MKELVERVLDAEIKLYGGEDHFEIAATKTNLTEIYILLEEYTKAKTLLFKVLEVYKKYYGKKHHINVAIAEFNYAKTCLNLNEDLDSALILAYRVKKKFDEHYKEGHRHREEVNELIEAIKRKQSENEMSAAAR